MLLNNQNVCFIVGGFRRRFQPLGEAYNQPRDE